MVYYMKDEGIEMQINWESFATYNQDIRGIRFKFEDLCRQLFANENLLEISSSDISMLIRIIMD